MKIIKKYICECGAEMKRDRTESYSGWGSYITNVYYKCPKCGKEDKEHHNGGLTPSGRRAERDPDFARNFYR